MGCAIATAALGTDAQFDLEVLRTFRDEVVVGRMPAGQWLSQLYDRIKYPVAKMVQESRMLKKVYLYLFITPTLALLKQRDENKYLDKGANWFIFIFTFLPMLGLTTLLRLWQKRS